MSIYSDATWIVVVFALGSSVAGNLTSSTIMRLIAGIFIAGVSLFAEVNDLTVLGYLRSLQHEPSIGLVTFCLVSVCRVFPRWTMRERSTVQLNRFNFALFLAGLALYPMALGLGMFDPYALGYLPWFALAVSALTALTWWLPRNQLTAAWLTAAILAHYFRVGESDNLFDYLLDPISFILASIWVTRILINRMMVDRVSG